MEILGADTRGAADMAALAGSAGVLALIAAFVAYVSVALPCQRFVARRRSSRESWRRSADLRGLVGWGCAGILIGLVYLCLLLLADPGWIDVPLVVILCVVPAGAAFVSYRSSRDWAAWLAQDEGGGANLTPELRIRVSVRLAIRDYALTSWSAGLVVVVATGLATVPFRGAASVLATASVAWLWLVVLVLGRRVAVQLDPLTAFVRSYRTVIEFQREPRLPFGARVTTDPWDLTYGTAAVQRRRLFERADLRLSRQVRDFPHPARDQRRRGCGELLADFATSELDPTLLRQVFAGCVTGPLPTSGRTPAHELGSAMRPWSAFTRAGTVAVAAVSAAAAVAQATRTLS